MNRAILLFLLGFSTQAQAQEETAQASGALLRGLDKVSGQTTDITLKSGERAQLGTLNIALNECRYPAGNPAGDAFAGLDIREPGREAPVFQGWMIASTPALSAMDHARYDIWVIRCTTS